jgi:hypothetical protein
MYMGQLGRSAGLVFCFLFCMAQRRAPLCVLVLVLVILWRFLWGFFWDDGLMDNVNSLHFVLGLCDTTLYVIRMHRYQHHLCGN